MLVDSRSFVEHAHGVMRALYRLTPLTVTLMLGCGGAPPTPSEQPAQPEMAHATTPKPAPESRIDASPQPTMSDRSVEPTMRLHFIDVGQGDATLLEFSCAAMLIDLGGEKEGQFNSNKELSEYLDGFFDKRKDLKRTLALVALTHPHIDHARGHGLFTAKDPPFKADNVVTNGGTRGSGGRQQNKLQEWAKKSAKLKEVTTDDLPDKLGLTGPIIDPIACDDVDPKIQVLWGRLAKDPGWGKDKYDKLHFDNKNNHSLVIRVDFGQGAVLLTGDLQETAIKDVVARYNGTDLLDVDVYQVGHHGSHNATTVGLLEAMTPRTAIISMGPSVRKGKWTAWTHGHPRAHIVDLLASHVAMKRKKTTVRVAT